MPTIGNQSLPFDPSRSSGKPRDAQRFNGDGATLAFTLSSAVDSAVDIEVYVDNIPQEPLTAYDVNGNSITFTEAPPVGAYNVRVIYRNFQTGIYTSVADGSISYQKLANNIRLFTTDNFTGDNTTVAFALTTEPADANTVFVSVDGIVQRAPIHYTTSGTTITFTSAPPTSSNVHIRHLGFRTTSTVTALSANTTITQPVLASPSFTGTVQTGAAFTGNLSATGTLAITGAGTFSTTLGVTGVATLGNGAILGTPASGTVTNLTGTASININGTVGATTPAAGAFTNLKLTAGDFGIRTNTVDGSDDGYLSVSGGGGEGVTRGGFMYLSGNERPGAATAGTIRIYAGNVAAGDIYFYTANEVERLRIAYSGAVTMPTQPAFLVKAANQLDRTGDGTAYTMTWTTEIFDQGNNFASSTFTAPVTGKYRFSYGLSVEGVLSTHTSSSTQLVTSNRNILFQVANAYNIYDATNGISWLGGSTLTDMDAGDTATVSVTVSNGTKVIDLGDNSHFSGELVC